MTEQTKNIDDTTQLWHNRMGHMSQKGLKILANKDCFEKDQVSELKFCEDRKDTSCQFWSSSTCHKE